MKPPSKSCGFANRAASRPYPNPPPTQICCAYSVAAASGNATTKTRSTRRMFFKKETSCPSCLRGRIWSVRHRVQDHVDANRVSARREQIEILMRRRAFALPRVGDIGVVRRQHHQPLPRVENTLEVDLRAVGTALGGLSARAAPEPDVRHLRNAGHVVEHVQHRMRHGHVDEWKLARRQDAANLLDPVRPGNRSPGVIGPEKAALLKILAE